MSVCSLLSNADKIFYLFVFYLQIASEVNAAILKMEHQEMTYPKTKLSVLLKLILWAQEKLDKKNAKYPKMKDLATATISDHK